MTGGQVEIDQHKCYYCCCQRVIWMTKS